MAKASTSKTTAVKATKTKSHPGSTKKAAIASATTEKPNAGAEKKKVAASVIGAPAQLNQSSRKGKKAWRKNVDIGDVEKGLEEMRAEERVVGTALQNLKDSDLFQIDVKGDDSIRSYAPKFSSSQLTSAKILAQRSAVPAVVSRVTSSNPKRKASAITRDEKERLLKMAKRPRKGPFNSVADPGELQSGAGAVGLSEAVKSSGSFDPWADAGEEQEEIVPDGLETVRKKKVKAPVLPKPRDAIETPAVTAPHQGASYNPPVEAHHDLLLQAHLAEEKKVTALAKQAEVRLKMDGARHDDHGVDESIGVPAGMKLDLPTEDEESEENEEAVVAPKAVKATKQKTAAQKNKAAKVLAEKRALEERRARKKLLASIEMAKAIRKTNSKILTEREALKLEKRKQLQEKLRKGGLVGQRLGRHKVPERTVEVQLGEDLSESLRGLKPEGNLFRDRFESMQQRALVEPRSLVLPKRRKHRIVEYEKHAWKRFDRDNS